jgi:hypothetical protein
MKVKDFLMDNFVGLFFTVLLGGFVWGILSAGESVAAETGPTEVFYTTTRIEYEDGMVAYCVRAEDGWKWEFQCEFRGPDD